MARSRKGVFAPPHDCGWGWYMPSVCNVRNGKKRKPLFNFTMLSLHQLWMWTGVQKWFCRRFNYVSPSPLLRHSVVWVGVLTFEYLLIDLFALVDGRQIQMISFHCPETNNKDTDVDDDERNILNCFSHCIRLKNPTPLSLITVVPSCTPISNAEIFSTLKSLSGLFFAQGRNSPYSDTILLLLNIWNGMFALVYLWSGWKWRDCKYNITAV